MEKGNIGPILQDLQIGLKHLRSLYRLILIGALVVWGLSGSYTVQSNEQGVGRRFGKVVRKAVPPGMHYRLPWPVEKVDRLKVKDIRRVHIGYMKEMEKPDSAAIQRLTGDMNVISVGLLLQYTIRDATDYLFMTEDPDNLIKAVAEAVVTEVVGDMSVDEILTIGKLKIQDRTQQLTQKILDNYGCGIHILNANLQNISPPKEVMESFKDIINAQADMDKFISESHAYKNVIIPKAGGEAETLIRSAEAYAEKGINRAQGDTSRFLEVLEEYQKAPQVNRDRLYLETMEKIGPRIKKYIIPSRLDKHLIKIYGVGPTEKDTARAGTAGDIISAMQSLELEKHKPAEEARKDTDEFEFSSLTYSPNPTMVINLDTSIRYVNPALERLTGFSSAELLGKKVPYPWWTEETLGKTRFEIVDGVEEYFRRKNGQRFRVRRTSKPVRKEGKLQYYLASWVEVNEQK